MPVPVSGSPEAGAIVVLGGAAGAAEPPRIDVDLTNSSDRVRHAASLYAAGKAPLVVTTGGGVRVFDDIEPEANSMAVLLHEWGVPGNSILVEPESLNTRQNAVNTKRFLDEKGLDSVLLVTSAIHMRRALAAFRGAGVKAIPSPTDYSVLDQKNLGIGDFLPDAGALGGTTAALKEYLGFLFYRLRGWIN